MSVQSRLLGTLLGGAVGDAVGLFTEFFPRSHAIELYSPNPVFSLECIPPPGQIGVKQDQHRGMFTPSGWTDDTDHSLLILLSFLASGGTQIDPLDFAKRLKFWVINGLRCLDRLPLGLGRTVGNVVRDKEFEGDPFGTSVRYWDNTNRFVAANGAVMRTAVIGALLFQDAEGVNGVDRAMHTAVQVAATTHPDPRCLVSCAIVTGLVAAATRNELHTISDFDGIVQRGISFIQSPPLLSLPSSFTPTLLTQPQLDELHQHVYAPKLEDLQLDDRQKIGYTLKCLGAGTWALRQAIQTPEENRNDIFERCITDITMQGGDGDTNATVAGSLLGAYLDSSCIPQKWTQNLANVQWLVRKSDCAYALLEPNQPAYNWAEDPDVLIDGGKGAFTEDELKKRFDELMGLVGMRVYGGDGSGIPGWPPKKGAKAEKDGCVMC